MLDIAPLQPCLDVSSRCKYCGAPLAWYEDADGGRSATCALCCRTQHVEAERDRIPQHNHDRAGNMGTCSVCGCDGTEA
jgi:hypothetical protein